MFPCRLWSQLEYSCPIRLVLDSKGHVMCCSWLFCQKVFITLACYIFQSVIIGSEIYVEQQVVILCTSGWNLSRLSYLSMGFFLLKLFCTRSLPINYYCTSGASEKMAERVKKFSSRINAFISTNCILAYLLTWKKMPRRKKQQASAVIQHSSPVTAETAIGTVNSLLTLLPVPLIAQITLSLIKHILFSVLCVCFFPFS